MRAGVVPRRRGGGGLPAAALAPATRHPAALARSAGAHTCTVQRPAVADTEASTSRASRQKAARGMNFWVANLVQLLAPPPWYLRISCREG